MKKSDQTTTKTSSTQKDQKNVPMSKIKADLNKKFDTLLHTYQNDLVNLFGQAKEESIAMLSKLRPNTRVRRTKQEILAARAKETTKTKRVTQTNKEKPNAIVHKHIDTKTDDPNDKGNRLIDKKVEDMEYLTYNEKIVLKELMRAGHPVTTKELAQTIEKQTPVVRKMSKSELAYKQLIYNTAFQLEKAGIILKKPLDGKSYLYSLAEWEQDTQRKKRPRLQRV